MERQETLDIYYIDCRVLLFRFLRCFIEWTKRTFQIIVYIAYNLVFC